MATHEENKDGDLKEGDEIGQDAMSKLEESITADINNAIVNSFPTEREHENEATGTSQGRVSDPADPESTREVEGATGGSDVNRVTEQVSLMAMEENDQNAHMERRQKEREQLEKAVCDRADDLKRIIEQVKQRELAAVSAHFSKEVEELERLLKEEKQRQTRIEHTETFIKTFIERASPAQFLMYEDQLKAVIKQYTDMKLTPVDPSKYKAKDYKMEMIEKIIKEIDKDGKEKTQSKDKD